jgi:hypothetical protein
MGLQELAVKGHVPVTNLPQNEKPAWTGISRLFLVVITQKPTRNKVRTLCLCQPLTNITVMVLSAKFQMYRGQAWVFVKKLQTGLGDACL